MKTIVYVDAFNLYYGSLRKTQYKWLDLLSLSRKLLTKNTIIGIKYFTAMVSPRESDSSSCQRQNTYIRALKTLGNVECIFGKYLSHPVTMRKQFIEPGENPFVKVIKTEEKGSDVNIASHMLLDAFQHKCDCFALISGDSDLMTPVSMIRNVFNKPVGVINPQKKESKALKGVATFYKHIRENALKSSQFPDRLIDSNGVFYKPKEW